MTAASPLLLSLRACIVLCKKKSSRPRFTALSFKITIANHGLRFRTSNLIVDPKCSHDTNLGTTYDTKTVIQIGWLFLYMARKPLKTLGFSALRMPRQPLRCPAFHSGVWAAKMAEKPAAGLHPFGNGQGCMARPRRGRPRQNQPSAKRFYFFAEGVFSFIGWSKHRGPAYPYNSEGRAAWRSSRGAGISAVPRRIRRVPRPASGR